MKNLVMSALALGALSQAAGCIFVTDDPPSGTGSIDVTWNMVDTFTDDGVTQGCAGAGTATIYARAGSGTPYTDIFTCADGGGTAMDLPLGTYTVWVDITNNSGTALYAQSEAATITLTRDGQVATAVYTIENVNGFFDVVWDLDGGASDCADAAGEDGVSILSTISGTTEGLDDIFDCENYGGVTAALPIGNYVVVAEVIDAANFSLGSSGVVQTSIDYGNEFVELDFNIILD